MFTHSLNSVRITDIPLDAEAGVLTQLAHNIVASRGPRERWKIRSLIARLAIVDFSVPVNSLAPHFQAKTGTITFSSGELKKKALRHGGEIPYGIDDVFNDITVLYSAADPDLE